MMKNTAIATATTQNMVRLKLRKMFLKAMVMIIPKAPCL
jgi:hypothetical protein